MRDTQSGTSSSECTCEVAPHNFCPKHGAPMPRSWDFLKVENMPPCRLCDQRIEPGQWITSDGVHFDCAQQYPDAMFG